MYCTKCGEKIGEDVKFCPKCGTQNQYAKGAMGSQEELAKDKKDGFEGGFDKAVDVATAGFNTATNAVEDMGEKLSKKVGGDSLLWKIIVLSSAGLMALSTLFPYISFGGFYSVNLFGSEEALLIIMAVGILAVCGVGITFTILDKKKVVMGMGIAGGALAILLVIGTLISFAEASSYFGGSVFSLLGIAFYLIAISGIVYCVSSLIYLKK